MHARFLNRLPRIIIGCGLLLVAASCTLVEERIDRTAAGPNVPADTAVHMELEPAEKSNEIAAQTVPPGALKVTITEAILLCLENNRSLVVERLNPSKEFRKALPGFFVRGFLIAVFTRFDLILASAPPLA